MEIEMEEFTVYFGKRHNDLMMYCRQRVMESIMQWMTSRFLA